MMNLLVVGQVIAAAYILRLWNRLKRIDRVLADIQVDARSSSSRSGEIADAVGRIETKVNGIDHRLEGLAAFYVQQG